MFDAMYKITVLLYRTLETHSIDRYQFIDTVLQCNTIYIFMSMGYSLFLQSPPTINNFFEFKPQAFVLVFGWLHREHIQKSSLQSCWMLWDCAFFVEEILGSKSWVSRKSRLKDF